MRFHTPIRAISHTSVVALGGLFGCGARPEAPPPPPGPPALADACADVGPPRVVPVGEKVFVAIGYDLANTIAVTTADGVVIVDTGMTVERAEAARSALRAVAPGPIRAVVYTHGHLDHVGGASAWVEPGTRIWATAALSERFYARYGELLPAEGARAARQFGRDVAPGAACSALGPLPDVDPAVLGAVLPTDVFTGQATFDVGGTEFVLIEAHGETEDHLVVWLPSLDTLLCGDDWYRAFPNLYTIRGTRPRPVDAWIDSLDAMRGLDPAALVPSHTAPVVGRDEVRSALRDYRDAIRFVRDAVIRGANRGERVDVLARTVHLPPHLAGNPILAETYGQVDWSVRGIYGGELGWFDGRAADLYPLPDDALAARTIEAMGGRDPVLARAREAVGADPRWAVHLLSLLEDAGAFPAETLDPEVARAYEAVAATVDNGNGRAYLLQSAVERRGGARPRTEPALPERFVDGLPLELLFDTLAGRLRPEDARDVEESVVFAFPAEGRTFVVTVRRGVCEVVEGEALPGTPAPLATVTTDAATWRRLAVRAEGPVAAVMDGLRVDGSVPGLIRFLGRFERGTWPAPAAKP